MFRSKRSSLVKRLWKLRVLPSSSSQQHENSNDTDALKSAANVLLKRLKEPALETLLAAVENKGVSASECVMLPKDEIRIGGGHGGTVKGQVTATPRTLCCQLWRWPELNDDGEHVLKRLPDCQAGDTTAESVCCNPYHWSRLITPDTPPPPYKASLLDRLSMPEGSSSGASLEVGGTPSPFRQSDGSSSSVTAPYWCNVAYWELRLRVGRLFTVRNDTVNVFQHLPHGDGMCLNALQESADRSEGSLQITDSSNNSTSNNTSNYNNQSGHSLHHRNTSNTNNTRGGGGGGHNNNNATTTNSKHSPGGNNNHHHHNPHGSAQHEESVFRTREKIGLGLVLMRESDGVWVYNRSDNPIFVNSPTLEIPNSRTCVVKKVPPGYTLKIYDYERSELLKYLREPVSGDGPYDPNSVRISFVKGWGPHYSRQFITSCPCWIEVLLRREDR